MSTHLHFIVWAYTKKVGDNYIDNTVIDVICSSSSEALERAQNLLSGKQYRMHMIVEHIDGQPCGRS